MGSAVSFGRQRTGAQPDAPSHRYATSPAAGAAWDRCIQGARNPTLTLGPDAFDAACGELMRMVGRDYLPTLIVGVRSGGLAVAEAMCRAAQSPVPVLPLTCRRPGTSVKSRLPLLRSGLAFLPEAWRNSLRHAEHNWTAGRRRSAGRAQVNLDEAGAIGAWLIGAPQKQHVLVVDDAVDSGVTLQAVLRTLCLVCPPQTRFRSAVITVTLEAPVAEPDYALYRGVLCRFPWSFDAVR